MIRSKLSVIIICLFISSCAPKMYINVDNKRIPDNYYQLQTIGDVTLNLNLLFQNFFITKNDGERVLASKELSFTKSNKISSKNLLDVKVKCKIDNPAKKEYNVWVEFVIHDSNEPFSTKITKQLYSGKIRSQILTVNIPTLKKGVVKTTIRFIDATEYPILVLNNIEVVYN